MQFETNKSIKTTKKALSLLIALVALAGMAPLISVADSSYVDVPAGHWAYYVIELWSGDGYGVLHGDGDGTFAPSRGLTLGELAAILSRTFGYTKRAPADVTPEWADEYVEKAVAAGIIEHAGAIDADVLVTREQAIRYIALAYNIAPLDGDTTFADDTAFGAEYKPYVKAFQKLGYVVGRPNNIFDPKAPYTRAEAMQVMDNTTSDILDRTADGKTYTKNVIVRTASVTIAGSTIDGNLIVGQGVGDGEVYVTDTTIEGDLYAFGGGANSIFLDNLSVGGSLVVKRYGSSDTARVALSGGSNFGMITLFTSAIVETLDRMDGTKIEAEIPAGFLAGSKFEFIGEFSHITNNGKGADITITGAVGTLSLNESAHISGSGKIGVAEISADAKEGTNFETKPGNMS